MDNKPPDNELDRLIKLHDAAIELNTVSTREGLLRVACTQFVSIFNAAGCALSIWNREDDTVQTIADYWGESNDTNFEMSGHFLLKDYPLTRKVLETQQYIYLSVTDENIDPNEIELLKSFDVHSMLMLPLQNRKDVMGLIEIYFDEGYQINPIDLMLTELFSNHVEVSLQNLELRASLEIAANYDHLTGLCSRRYFENQLTQIVRQTKQVQNRSIAIFYIDIDDFKDFNDAHGHTFGDNVLKTIATILSDVIGDKGIVARYGGDEFLILLPNPKNLNHIKTITQQLLNAIGNPHQVDETIIKLSASIGVYFPSATQNITPAECIAKADMAAYTAKNKGNIQSEIILE